MIMNQISSLKVLKCNESQSQSQSQSKDIDVLSLAIIHFHLANLVEFKCDSDIFSEFISQVSHNLQSLTINFKSEISNGLLDLIFSQNNFKIANLQYFFICSLTKHSLTLTKLTLKNCKISFPFIAMFKNLQELILYQECSANHIFYQLQDTYFSQLKILKIIYKNNFSDVEMLINFLEINGKNLTEFYIYHYYNRSLNLVLAEFCPNLKILRIQIKKEEEETLKLILSNCQYLEIIEYPFACNYVFNFYNILANYSQEYFYGLILDYSFAWPVWSMDSLYEDLKDLEEFFINWQDRVSQRSLSLIIYIPDDIYYIKNMNDIKILIEKYMKLDIKFKKFEIKKVPRYKVK
ncbi:uncharacterized protein OCT59_024659 [Rhizophagus irregularis]|uniref:Uncharacterized protein n=1 Tax=Rhizophagus irregularis (strain DAOM 181602 / DAOM 197198 / MUCL 43194) TaxID=747089 RepID=U9SS22_RHIID|nr:hypothetical protein OCT59_024659 [Rhizophagus irregularis]GBC19344.1 hypothetical protein GLOIN_2v1876960 [Rhizophagus irregularis DAOM 181602=DAOM 197198]